ncbi:MAG: DUF4870 domain-containing protein [Bacillota bacterium]
MQPPEPTQEERLVSGIAHIAILFSALGLVVNIALLLSFRHRSPFAASHLRQALGLQVISAILAWAIGLYLLLTSFHVGFGHLGPRLLLGRAIQVGLVVLVINGVKLTLAILGAVHAFGGKVYRYPLVGDLLAGGE